jgi:hypothetical protein
MRLCNRAAHSLENLDVVHVQNREFIICRDDETEFDTIAKSDQNLDCLSKPSAAQSPGRASLRDPPASTARHEGLDWPRPMQIGIWQTVQGESLLSIESQ